jgi:hypothetical protein
MLLRHHRLVLWNFCGFFLLLPSQSCCSVNYIKTRTNYYEYKYYVFFSVFVLCRRALFILLKCLFFNYFFGICPFLKKSFVLFFSLWITFTALKKHKTYFTWEREIKEKWVCVFSFFKYIMYKKVVVWFSVSFTFQLYKCKWIVSKKEIYT